MPDREQVRARIEQTGILPALRLHSPDDALFAARTLFDSGIGIAELAMTTPGALEVLCELSRNSPDAMVGAGTVLDVDTARRCVDAGALFLTSTGLDVEVIEFARTAGILVIPGALTPTEVMAATRAGGEIVKIFPCASVGGPSYIRALHGPFPHVPLIASGGVTQVTAADFIRAGAFAVGIGKDLIPPEAIRLRNQSWIHELSRRFLGLVREARVTKHGH